jgi:hypothetical protein
MRRLEGPQETERVVGVRRAAQVFAAFGESDTAAAPFYSSSVKLLTFCRLHSLPLVAGLEAHS